VGLLIDLADFYDVDIREIIDGERKCASMDPKTKDTLKKVAAYATQGEKKAQSKTVNIALGITLAMLLCTILFAGEHTGVLYGILPEALCTFLLDSVYVLAGVTLVAYLKVRWALEKPSREPERAVAATVVSKEVKPGTQSSGRSMMGYSFAVTFQTEEGQTLELYAYEVEFGALKEGMSGILTYQGPYFVSFEEKPETDGVGGITSSEPLNPPPASVGRTESGNPQSGKKGNYWIKWIFFWVFITGLIVLLSLPNLTGARGKIVHIALPFEVGSVANVEMYHLDGSSRFAEKKVIVAEETIKTLYDMFESIPLKDKKEEETADATTTSFRFNLADGTSYELIYRCYGVKKGYLISSTGNFDCFTSADIGSYWNNIDLDVIQVASSELPK